MKRATKEAIEEDGRKAAKVGKGRRKKRDLLDQMSEGRINDFIRIKHSNLVAGTEEK